MILFKMESYYLDISREIQKNVLRFICSVLCRWKLLPTCLSVYHVLNSQKRALDPLELQMVMSHHLSMGINPGSSGREAGALNHQPSL